MTSSLAFHSPFSSPPLPFFSGTGSSSLVPAKMHVAIGGYAFMIDTTKYTRQTLPRQRNNQNQTGEPGEESLNPMGYWRRSAQRFDLAAGQPYFDDNLPDITSSRRRFYSSKGIDVFSDPHAFSLLPDTTAVNATDITSTNLQILAVNGYLYALIGSSLYFTATPEAAAPLTFTAEALGHAGTMICSDGSYIYVAEAGFKLQRSLYGHSAGASDFDPGTIKPEFIAFANGRLVAALDNQVWELDATGAVVGSGIWNYPYGTAANVNVTSAIGTPAGIFFSVTIGNRSEVYFSTVDSTSGDLTAATYAGCMPVGEYINTMAYYGTVLVLGTSRGIRVARIGGSQDVAQLEIQPLVDLGVSVTCLEPQAQFVYFGWSNLDSTSTGLGRMDLSKSTGLSTPYTTVLIPAYATDLMATNQGTVSSIATVNNRRYFTVVSSTGNIYRESVTRKVASGTLDSGWVRMGSLIYKQYAGVEVTHDALNGTVAVSVEGPDRTTRSLGMSSDTGALDSNLFDTQLRARAAKLHFALTRSATNDLAGPVIRSWTLDAVPASPTVDEINVPLLLDSEVRDLRGERERVDPLDAFDYLNSLCHDGTIVTYQEGENNEQVQVSQVIMDVQADRKWTQPEAFKGQRRKWLSGTVYVKLTTREV